jgi:hypothetical protein
MEDKKESHLKLTFPIGESPGFSWLLQCGFVVKAGSCGSVRRFLRDEMNLNTDFIENVIQSIFLDGKPVDDLDQARVKDGCTLALSAAMPGLVGATMRRGGYYAALRSGISYKENNVFESSHAGFVTVKLFNLVASELESALMKQGIRVRAEALEEFLKSRPVGFWTRLESIALDGSRITVEELKQWTAPKGLVLLSVESACH